MGEGAKEVIKIGIIGEGSLARLFITQFLKTDVSLSLLKSETSNFFDEKHIRYHDSISSLARYCSIIITILSDGPELESILFNDNGIANSISSTNIVIDMSPVSPEYIQEISEQLVESEIPFLDALIINEEQDDSGLIQMLLIGGDKHAFDRVLPVFRPIVKAIKHFDANGASQFYRQAFVVRAQNDKTKLLN